MENSNKPLWQLTVNELMEILDSKKENTIIIEQKDEYVYGIAGLAKLLGCSINHAGAIKRSGQLDGAIIQNGRKIIINAPKALELCNRKENE